MLGIRSGTQVTERVLAAAPDLLAVGAFCIGVNQIDLAAASRRGIAVFNAPFSNTRSVVELAVAEIIAMTRRLTDKNAQMHAGTWDKSAAGSHEVRGRRLGIVGYGNIGGQLSVLAENLGMTVFFYDTADKLALGNARRCGTLEELLEISDVVTLHVDGRPGNSGLFGEAEFAAMRPGSLFLNLSRGFVVDHARAAPAHRVRPPGRGGGRRVPAGAAGPRRGVPLRAARPAQRHPDPACRRLDRGGAAGHRRVRGRQAARLRQLRRDLAEREPAAGRAAAHPGHAPAGAPAPQRARRAGRHQPAARRARRQHRGPAARHPGRARLRAHRHRHRVPGRHAGPACATWTSPSGCAPPGRADRAHG